MGRGRPPTTSPCQCFQGIQMQRYSPMMTLPAKNAASFVYLQPKQPSVQGPGKDAKALGTGVLVTLFDGAGPSRFSYKQFLIRTSIEESSF
jgi:hypothetical protein